MTSWAIAVDCADADRLGRFWATALGCAPAPVPTRWGSWQQRFDDFEVPEPKRVENRPHIDLKVGGGRHVAWEECWPRVLTEVQRLVAAGARAVEQVDHDGRGDHFVLGDPEGDEFCVVQRRRSRPPGLWRVVAPGSAGPGGASIVAHSWTWSASRVVPQ